MFWFYVSRRKIEVKRPDILVSDSINVYPCIFQFSADWKGLNKHAVFKAGQTSIEIILGSDNTCNIPWEVLIKPKLEVMVGVYGTQGESVILNTVWRSLGKVEAGPHTKNESGQEPTPDELDQVLGMIGSLDELETDDKNTIVDAINSVNYKFGHALIKNGKDVYVDVANNDTEDRTLPISAAAVDTTVGNIEALLKTI